MSIWVYGEQVVKSSLQFMCLSVYQTILSHIWVKIKEGSVPFPLFEVVHWKDTYNTHVAGQTSHCLFGAKRLLTKSLKYKKTAQTEATTDKNVQIPLLKYIFMVLLQKLVSHLLQYFACYQR